MLKCRLEDARWPDTQGRSHQSDRRIDAAKWAFDFGGVTAHKFDKQE